MHRSRSATTALIAVEIAFVLVAALTPVFLDLLRSFPSTTGQVLLLALNTLLGALVGLQFPVAARICVRGTGRIAAPGGLLYAADLLGACAGALSVSALLVPTLGLPRTCLLIAGVKGLSLAVIAFNKKEGQPSGPPALTTDH